MSLAQKFGPLEGDFSALEDDTALCNTEHTDLWGVVQRQKSRQDMFNVVYESIVTALCNRLKLLAKKISFH